MPELADVEGFKRYIARYASGRKVQGVTVRDAGVLRNRSLRGLSSAVTGKKLGKPERAGKWLLLPAGSSVLLLHFGMTGGVSWTSAPSEPERDDRVVFHLDGGELRYRSMRKLGGIWVAGDTDEAERIMGPLGPDALAVSKRRFRELLEGRRGQIKSALMDQELLAGLGNELSDEIFWRAKMYPGTPVSKLRDRDIGALYDAMRTVLRESARHGRIPSKGRWLNAVRGEDEPRCPRCRGPVRTSKIAGRTSYWCPRCQPK